MTAPATLPQQPQQSDFALSKWLERATVACLILLAAAAPISIAATQTAWLLSMLFWVARFFFRPRPPLYRTAVDYALLGFFILSLISALCSYEPDLSIGKLPAASLFTIVYVVAQNVSSHRVLRTLVIVLVTSSAVSAAYTFGVFAWGRGVKVRELPAGSPLAAVGVRAGDTILSVDGVAMNTPEEVEHAIATERPATEKVYRWPDGKVACVWDERSACVRLYRSEFVPTFNFPRQAFASGDTSAQRLGIGSWSRGRDERASGFYGQYQTYSEVLQLIASLALGLLVAHGNRLSWGALLCAAVFASLCGALLLTVTRASWAGVLLSSLTITILGARRRRMVLVFAAIALPLVIAGALVLQQKRGVGFLDRRDQSTTWRETVWREGVLLLTSKPRHLLVGVGMDTLKRRWPEWGMFDGGRLPWGHLHSTPLQIAFERGLLALAAWLVLLFAYARACWRLARQTHHDWIARGLALGALGGMIGFFASGLVHYNLGDSEVAMVFYLIMGLALAAERLHSDGHVGSSFPTRMIPVAERQ